LGLVVILCWFDVCWILLGLALQSGRLITQEEIQKLQAMEKAQELEVYIVVQSVLYPMQM
jgi:hypothetical protein